jgi:hypothetical protein
MDRALLRSMDQLARPLPLVADGDGLRLQGGEAAEPEAAQDGADGGARHGELAGNGGAAHALAPQPLDRRDLLGWRAMRRVAGRRLAVLQRRHPAGPEASEPGIGGALRHACCLRGIGNAPSLLADTAHQKRSTMHRHAGILVDVHPGLRLKVGWNRNPSLAAPSRMNNLHSFDS